MILRIVCGRVRDADVRQVAAALGGDGNAPDGRGSALRFHVGARRIDGDWELATLGVWDSPEAAGDPELEEDLAGPAWEVDEVALFEIDESLVRDGPGGDILRIATGRFSRHGTDIEMQELLRERLPTIGPEMTEAYVGRRILGRAVEVTFASAWTRDPADVSLERPLWQDIALRYDSFSLRVYRPVETGAAEVAAGV